MSEFWLKCSACRKELGFSTIHWVCSVSTCNRNRTRLVFCSVSCWDSHVADARHRDAWAVEARSPTKQAWQLEQANEAASAKPSAPASSSSPPSPGPMVRPAASSTSSPGGAPAAASPASSSAPPSSSGSSSAPAPSSSPTAAAGAPVRRFVDTSGGSAVASSAAPGAAAPNIELASGVEEEILVVVSKMKKYIRERSGMNCSDSVADALSAHLRLWCDQAIRNAATDGRKTVLDRDVPKPRSS